MKFKTLLMTMFCSIMVFGQTDSTLFTASEFNSYVFDETDSTPYTLSDLSFIPANEDHGNVVTWLTYTATNRVESEYGYRMVVSSDASFNNIIDTFYFDIPEFGGNVHSLGAYDIGNLINVYVRVDVFRELTTTTGEPPVVVTYHIGSSNVLEGLIGNEPSVYSYTYYVPHTANNADYSTQLYFDYNGNIDSEIQIVKDDYFMPDGVDVEELTLLSDEVRVIDTSTLFNVRANRQRVTIYSQYPIDNIRVLYVPTNGGHVSGVDVVETGNDYIELNGMFGNQNQFSGIAVTNLEDYTIDVQYTLFYIDLSTGLNERTATVQRPILRNQTEVFMLTDFLIPSSVNYIGTLEIASSNDSNITAVGVTFGNGAIEFTNAL